MINITYNYTGIWNLYSQDERVAYLKTIPKLVLAFDRNKTGFLVIRPIIKCLNMLLSQRQVCGSPGLIVCIDHFSRYALRRE